MHVVPKQVSSTRLMKLNAAQKQAVEHKSGPLLILAGAGSGKTRVITQRIARLIELGTDPAGILAVSFTNKSAAEMRERLAHLVDAKKAEKVWMSTFHSFGVRFLEDEHKALGYRFTIFDQSDVLGLIKQLMASLPQGSVRNLDAQTIASQISIWKNKNIRPETLSTKDEEYHDAAAELYPLYEQALKRFHALDFDDLVLKPLALLESDKALQAKWRKRFSHLLIDEFQDTNAAQLNLVQAIAPSTGNICVVGDDDQSIYGWRGAEPDNILRFKDHFENTTVIALEDNYRSTQPILDVANTVIAQATQRFVSKTLRAAGSKIKDAETVKLCEVPTTDDEAHFVAQEIKKLHGEGVALNKIAVLYRSAMQSRAIEAKFREERINNRVLGGAVLFDRKEIKDALAYLRLLIYPNDELAMRRIINTPPRGLGDVTMHKLEELANDQKLTLAGLVHKIPRSALLRVEVPGTLAALADTLENTRRKLASSNIDALTQTLMKDVGLADSFKHEKPEQARRRLANIDFIVQSLKRWQRTSDGYETLKSFLQRWTLDPQDDEQNTDNQVTLCTLHSSKGLEFDVVFLIGIVEGRLPHRRVHDPRATDIAPSSIDEERRLFYVGITRARKKLYLSVPKAQMQGPKQIPVTPSRFLANIPETSIERITPAFMAKLDDDEFLAASRALIASLSASS